MLPSQTWPPNCEIGMWYRSRGICFFIKLFIRLFLDTDILDGVNTIKTCYIVKCPTDPSVYLNLINNVLLRTDSLSAMNLGVLCIFLICISRTMFGPISL